MENYTPKIIENTHVVYLEMVIEATKCYLCKKIMLPKKSGRIFPKYMNMDQDAQMKRAGFVYSTNIEVDGKRICVECKNAGKADIQCVLCNEKKPSDKVQQSFGYPPEYLCKDCYETKPAKIWEEKCDKLLEDHLYDLDT